MNNSKRVPKVDKLVDEACKFALQVFFVQCAGLGDPCAGRQWRRAHVLTNMQQTN